MHKNKHLLLQNWENLSFMHWIVNKDILGKYIPEGLELDLYQNNAFVGVIPFMMKMLDQDGAQVFHLFLIFQSLTYVHM